MVPSNRAPLLPGGQDHVTAGQCEEVQTRWYQEARGLAQGDHLGVVSLMAGVGGGHIWNKSITEGPKNSPGLKQMEC